MPATCRIDADAGIVYTTVVGTVGIEELIEELTAVLEHPDFRPGLRGLADFREASTDLYSRDIQRIVDLMSVHRSRIGPSRTAIVLSTEVSYGLARMYQHLAADTSIETRIFTDVDKARRWIEADDPGE